MSMAAPTAAQLSALQSAAEVAAKNAYAPYSHFFVGAALLLTNGEIVAGANFENASYGLSVCAERAAVGAAVTRFGPEMRIAAVYVANRNNAESAPCGACRQVLAEFSAPDTPVYFAAGNEVKMQLLSALLPASFKLGR
jgi:cytidine deaminase